MVVCAAAAACRVAEKPDESVKPAVTAIATALRTSKRDRTPIAVLPTHCANRRCCTCGLMNHSQPDVEQYNVSRANVQRRRHRHSFDGTMQCSTGTMTRRLN